MASCPSCHNSVEILDKHLGTLFTCPSCNAVFFINWDGEPEMGVHEEEPGEETHIGPPPVSAPEPEPAYSEAPSGYEEPASPHEQVFESGEVYDSAYPPEDFQSPSNEMNSIPEPSTPDAGAFEEPEVQTIPNSYLSPAHEGDGSLMEAAPPSEEEPAPSSENDGYDFSRSLDQQPEEPVSHGMSDSADFSDVTDFANANSEAGPLAYTVIIDGVESSQLLKQLREEMTDSRFGWDVTDVLSRLAGGRLVLNGLSPAKASVLINRIKYLPFKISWRQDVLSGP